MVETLTNGVPTLDLTGQNALITGAASGIGAATARRFAALGATLHLADIDDARGAALASELGATYHHLVVADPGAWAALDVATQVDIIFLNAGVSTRPPDAEPNDVPMGEVTDAAYRRIMSINVDGVVFGARAALPAMVARGGGHIVITASMAGLGPIPFDPIYGLTKHAMVGFAKSLGVTYGPMGVCTSAICPGFADTNIISGELKDMLGQVGVPVMSADRVADTVVTALAAAEPGSLWAVWGDLPIARYEPNPVFPEMEQGIGSMLDLPEAMAADEAASA
ncbi:MAG TPA: SDR family oxidoreductase [Ilumatobacteraceae bacterium]|nr:SDR family oxidoreductase [Ilumatobacteraceae bacterium]